MILVGELKCHQEQNENAQHINHRDYAITRLSFLRGRVDHKKSQQIVPIDYTVDGQKVPDVHRRLICQKVSVSRNLSQKVIPSDEDFSCLYPTFTSEVITFR